MRIADLNTGAAQLRDALDGLRQAWSDASPHWNDANSRNFEESHLRPLASDMASAFPAIDQLATVLAQAERACGPW
ncbi:MAG: hypothetical protein HY290_24815 [Planctomycetia bacterium]|nr:hypothetical protein [Planctomycetia bacterium]